MLVISKLRLHHGTYFKNLIPKSIHFAPKILSIIV
jgi:hypothetical protein